MKLIMKYIITVFLMLLMFIVVFLVVAPYFGWRIHTAIGDSMTPVLKSGGIVITQPVEPADIKLGDIITYSRYDTLVVHRVVEIIEDDSLLFRTKGDANEEPDSHLVHDYDITGRVYLYIPILGQVVQFMKTPIGLGLFLLIPGLIIISMNMRNTPRVFIKQ